MQITTDKEPALYAAIDNILRIGLNIEISNTRTTV